MSTTSAATPIRTANVFVLGILFLNSLGAGVLIPVLPALVEQLTGREPEAAGLVNGLLLSVYAGATFLFSPLLGRLSDRLGRRPVLLLAAMGAMLDYALCALASTFAVLLVARALAGVFGASTTVANAALADITPAEDRGASFGRSSAVTGVGLICGPLIGGALMEWGLRLPFIAACVLAACELGFGLVFFPETLREMSPRRIGLIDVNPLAAVRRFRELPVPAPLLLALILFQLAGSAGQAVLVLFVQARLGWNGVQVGLLMTTLACTSIIVRFLGVRAALALLGEAGAILVGLCFSAAGTLALAYVTTGWQLYAAVIFGQMGTLAAPVMFGLLSRAVPAQMQGEALGTVTSTLAVAVMIAPLLGAVAFGRSGIQAMIHGGEPVFVLCALLLLAAVAAVAWGLWADIGRHSNYRDGEVAE